ncbi:MAG: glucosaminidase domain-containing protein [Blautia sp.]|nr:glucosaminidase domain-containing protein [Blautia sp.]MDY3997900.1 glucosaminidase domain-containing protein [Blautia sp.]
MRKRSGKNKKLLWRIKVLAGVLIIWAPVCLHFWNSVPGDIIKTAVGSFGSKTAEAASGETDLSQEGQIGKPSGSSVFGDSRVDDSTDNTYEYYTIMGKTTVAEADMVSQFNSRNVEYPSSILGEGGAGTIEEFCSIIVEEADAEGVRAEVVFEQSMLETGWLQYGGDSSAEQFNFAGLGTTGDGVAGNCFPDVRTGIRAQVQHLKAYASSEDLVNECVDERFDYVTRESAPYVEWLGIQENPYGGGWAAGEKYGYKIRVLLAELKGTEYTMPENAAEDNTTVTSGN